MTYEQIRQLITAKMVAFTGLPQASIDYPNTQTFTPPAEGLWCRLNIQHATAFMAGMADKPYTRKAWADQHSVFRPCRHRHQGAQRPGRPAGGALCLLGIRRP